MEGGENTSKEIMDVREMGCENMIKVALMAGMKRRIV
jgi:hypothetical protein